MSENQPLEAQNPQGQFTQPAPTPQKKSGLGIASLVLGIIAIVGSWIPILNNISFLLAIIGLILGIVGIFSIRKGKVGGKGLTIAAVVINVIAIVIVICTQWVFGKALDEATKDLNAGSTVVATSEKADTGDSKKTDKNADNSKLAVGNAVTLDNGLQVSVNSKTEKTDQAGNKYLLVTVSYKNTGSEPVDYASYDWKQTSSSGNMEDPEIAILDKEPLSNGTLKPGGTVSGIVPVKTDAASISYFGNLFEKEAAATWLFN
ncbi:MAG: hypothetical protein Q618_VCMC00001G0028 [Varibaculum cambriense DORA_20]|uniref:DUF4190 domain-containing protein n=1 Tax=Varibaculum cambriense TaxID=184870 RepID=UPI0003D67D0D|nr:DUF4190 domain-containing protein [Varibaculum cambriense]ETI82447.1 MAG: hypothetical protein Q618_VCMC00001G0028 [Varibaculum cambriense DORA_20]